MDMIVDVVGIEKRKSWKDNDMPRVPTKDRPLNMPCDDPEGCKHFKAEMKLREQIKKLKAHIKLLSPYADHLPHCQGMVDSFTIDCDCGLEKALKG